MIGNPVGMAIGEAVFRATPGEIVSRRVLEDTVDCVLHGQQEKFKGSLSGAALRNAFGE